MTRLYVAESALDTAEADLDGSPDAEHAEPSIAPLSVEADHSSRCARCGTSDAPLEPDPELTGRLRCKSVRPFTAARACWQRIKPHCPPWCITQHTSTATAVKNGGWNHSAPKIQTVIPDADYANRPEIFNLTVGTWEHLGGTTDRPLISMDSDNIDIALDSDHARALASTLLVAARLADIPAPQE